MSVLSLFTLADRVESLPPSAWAPEWVETFADWQPGGAHASATNGVWRTHLTDDFQSLADGWKIHVSSGVSSSHAVLRTVTDICREHEVSFKHLCSSALLAAFNSKWAPRSASGKFAVLYPHRDSFEELAQILHERLPRSNGPHVLSDFQWSENSSVFVRWGAFKRRTEWTPEGRRILLVEDSQGSREDVRSIPASTASLPMAELGLVEKRPRPPMFDMDVTVTGAVQITSAGGVYVGLRGDREVIIKEARQAVDERPGQVPAAERLACEAKTLEMLRGVQGIPEKFELKDIGVHRFLVTSKLDGVPLRSWVARHHPALQGRSSPEAFDSYLHLCSKIDRGLRDLLALLHARGIAHNDLHPGNVLVSPDLQISLIDFEQSSPASTTGRPPNGCPGFLTREGIASETDMAALDVMSHWMLNPGWGGTVHLDRTCAEQLIAETRSMYGDQAEAACTAAEKALPRLQLHTAQDIHDGRDWSARRLEDSSRAIPLDALSHRGILASLGLAVGRGGHLLDAHDSGSWGPAVDRWEQSAENAASDEPGLWFGWSGIAVCAQLLGRKTLAETVFDRALESAAGCTDVSLSTGLAGILASALVLGRTEAAEELGRRIVAVWPGSSQNRTPGLESGGAGTARILMNLERRIGDVGGFRDTAHALITEDRSAVVQQENGAQLRIGKRLLPYLGTGSVGLAVAMADLGLPAEQWRPLAAAAAYPLVLDGGAGEGRAGLIAGLIWLGELTGTSYAAEIRCQRERMRNHLVRTPYGLALAGRGGNRVSGDLLTGTAGWSAVESKLDGTPRPSWRGLSILFGACHSD
jgi:serine/threonine protein kinase